MSGSNLDETSEQTHGREIEPNAHGRGKKDKSHDVVDNMEVRLAKVELSHGRHSGEVGLDRARHQKGLKGFKGADPRPS